MDTQNDKVEKFRNRALSIILLLILLAMASCSTTHLGGNGTTNGDGYTSHENGYIVYQTDKILVSMNVGTAGQRTMEKRSWGFDGTHFEAEEEYLDSRPDLISDLQNRKTIQFIISQ